MKRIVLVDCKNIDCFRETLNILEKMKYWDIILLLDKGQKLFKKPRTKNKLTIIRRNNNPENIPPFIILNKIINEKYASGLIVCNEEYYDTTIKDFKKIIFI